MSIAEEINNRIAAMKPIMRYAGPYDIYLSNQRIDELKAEMGWDASTHNDALVFNGHRIVPNKHSERLRDNRITVMGQGWRNKSLKDGQEAEQAIASQEAAGIFIGGIWCG